MSGLELGVEVHQQKFLAEGDTAMHAILTVSARGGPREPAKHAAEVLLVDCSTSMRHPHTKIEEAKRAAAAAIGVLPDGVLFGVVRGTEAAHQVYPPEDRLVAASDATRRAAQQAVAHLGAYGGTAMGTWLERARRLFARHPDAVRHAILLTDGKNQSETHETLVRTLDTCEGQFVCDARGIGDGWEPAELAEIVKVLRGNADSVVEDHLLADDFRQLIENAMTKVLPEVRLRIGTMDFSTLRFVKQVRPNEYDLTDRCRAAGEGEQLLSLGSWAGEESQDYHVCFDLDPSLPPSYDRDRQLAWVELEPGGGEPVAVLGRWTHDPVQPTLVHPMVLQYTVQAELGEALAEGGDALAAGRAEAAEQAWGKAWRLAAEQGNDEILRRLGRVVEPRAEGVRLRPDASRSEVLNVLISRVSQIGGTEHVAAPEDPADVATMACPHCGEPTPARGRFCAVCGKAVGEASA